MAAVGLLTAVAAPAWAANYTVTVGGDATPTDHVVAADSAAAPRWSYEKPDGTKLSMSCSRMTLDLRVRSGASGGTLAAVPSGSSSGCTWPGGSMWYPHVGTWQLDLTGPATSGDSDVIDGVLRNVRIDNAYAICSFRTVGEARVRFHEASQKLEIVETGLTGRLRQTQVQGCLGQLRNDGAVDWEATLDLSSSGGPIRVS
jgi:hypothetical protein